ncbi:MAG: hypothetical protein ABSA02_09635 [Trebonia sp.]
MRRRGDAVLQALGKKRGPGDERTAAQPLRDALREAGALPRRTCLPVDYEAPSLGYG